MADLSLETSKIEPSKIVMLDREGNPHLKDDNDPKSVMTLTLYDPMSQEYRDSDCELLDILRDMFKGKGEDYTLEAKRSADLRLEKAARSIKEWDILLGGECPELTVESAKDLLSKLFYWVEQIEEHNHKGKDFTLASLGG